MSGTVANSLLLVAREEERCEKCFDEERSGEEDGGVGGTKQNPGGGCLCQ